MELERSLESVHFAIMGSPGVVDASTSFDFESGQITTMVVLEAGVASEPTRAGLLGVATQSVLTANETRLDAITISVVIADGEVSGIDSNSEHLGGENLSGCTSGFSTISGSVRGVATAGHCANAQADYPSNLTFKAEHQGTHGDFQWHTGPQGEPDDFYSGDVSSTETDRRDVSSVVAPVVGQSLCRNGITSFKDCQEVGKLNVCVGSVCNLVQMGADLSAGGDNGGPVFWGNAAYGFHRGRMSTLSGHIAAICSPEPIVSTMPLEYFIATS